MTIVGTALFVGFAAGFGFGFLAALIKYIITAVVHWMKG